MSAISQVKVEEAPHALEQFRRTELSTASVTTPDDGVESDVDAGLAERFVEQNALVMRDKFVAVPVNDQKGRVVRTDIGDRVAAANLLRVLLNRPADEWAFRRIRPVMNDGASGGIHAEKIGWAEIIDDGLNAARYAGIAEISFEIRHSIKGCAGVRRVAPAGSPAAGV